MNRVILAVLAALTAATCSSAPLAAQDVWTEIGPAPITTGPYTGRVAALACSHRDPGLYYAGGADGGVWRTRTGGATWQPVGDGLPSAAIGALALDPTDDRRVYAGTGEANFANHSRYGLGFAWSDDGGDHWQLTGVAEFAGRCFARIAVDSGDPKVLYAATTHAGGFPARAAARGHPRANGPIGIWKSTDRGLTWSQLTGGLPAGVSATDVAVDPQDGRIVWAAVGDVFGHVANGVYKSTDGGATFARVTGLPSGTGVGRITLALAPSRGSRVLAQLVRPASASGGGASTLGTYRSDDGGRTWSSLPAGSYQATYGWYLCTSIVHPTDPDVLLIGGLSARRSTNAGATWRTVTPPHVDCHAWAFDAAGRLLSGNDGGVHRSDDLGSSWRSINGDLGLIQFYAGISIHPANGDVVYGGLQDNGSVRRIGSGLDKRWVRVLGGDGGYTSMDAGGRRVFVEFQGTGRLYRSVDNGPFQYVGRGLTGRNCFLPPHAVHPQDPLLMVYGTERVWRSTDGAGSWSPISGDLTLGSGAVQALAFAPNDPQTIWAGTNDGLVHVTQDGGRSWRRVLSGIPTWPRVKRPFAVHPTDGARCWFAVSAFGVDQVRYTADAGRSWTAIDGDLPDLPVNTVAIDVQSGEPPLVYAGTDRGVFRSDDAGRTWLPYGGALPNAPVVDLRVDAPRRRLVAATQGRGAWHIDALPRGEWPPTFARHR